MKGGERKRLTHEQNLELAKGKEKVIILFDEMVRPAPTSEIAPDKPKSLENVERGENLVDKDFYFVIILPDRVTSFESGT